MPVDLHVEIGHFVGAQGLVGDRRQQQRGGTGGLRVFDQVQHVPGAHGAVPHHDRRPVGRLDGQPRDARALLAPQVGVVARTAKRADRVDARLRKPRHEADQRRFVYAALVHLREREGAQSREHQPARSDRPSAPSRRTPASASAKRVAARAEIADVVTRSAA